MDTSKLEVAALEKTAELADQSALMELHSLELALIGGGNGTVIIG